MGTKRLAQRLNGDAPAWLQAAVFGLFPSSMAAAAVFILLVGLLPSTASNLIPLLVFGLGLASWGGYIMWATPRVGVLRIYSETLARTLDEPIDAARNRVWRSGGPGWKTLGLPALAPLLALVLPASLLMIASVPAIVASWDQASGSYTHSLSPTGWLLIAASVVLIAAIGWLVYRLAKTDETMRLLRQAARDSRQAEALVDEAVELTRGVYPRSTASWIGGAALSVWFGSITFGNVVDLLHIGQPLETALWVILSTTLSVAAIRYARLAGAPVAVWTGVVVWMLVGTALAGLMYMSMWDAFGPSLLDGTAGDWLAPNEAVRQLVLGLLSDAPLVVAAWATATRTKPRPSPPA